MQLTEFITAIIIISPSGVMAPRPMTAVTVGKGSKSPWAGAALALGHGAVEIPIAIAIYTGFGSLMQISYMR
jgi:threonine/homoserine/homoserine lactone efflux protein